MEKLYTTNEAAELLKITPVAVRLRARRLKFKRKGRDWLFTAQELACLRNAPDGRKRKPKQP